MEKQKSEKSDNQKYSYGSVNLNKDMGIRLSGCVRSLKPWERIHLHAPNPAQELDRGNLRSYHEDPLVSATPQIQSLYRR